MLEIKELCFKHKNQKTDVLKNINFLAKKGELTVILGPNGSGKSSLFKCIMGIWEPYKGSILVNSQNINKLSYKNRAKIFAIVPQEHESTFPYTVFDIVLTGRTPFIGLFSTPALKDLKKVEEALKFLGIYHLKDKSYHQISGGEKQLVLIARALAQEAPFMLLDEPTSNLDFRNQIKVLCKIKELVYKKGLTVLLTLHDPNLASLFADKIIIIKNGTIIAQGNPQEILNENLIEKVYEIKVFIIQNNGIKIICPVFKLSEKNSFSEEVLK